MLWHMLELFLYVRSQLPFAGEPKSYGFGWFKGIFHALLTGGKRGGGD